ncbi:MAG: sulfite oxidase [Planctomycetaceae bacterium]|nr:sulfite oxidase [Planctomycetaceae bacterium]
MAEHARTAGWQPSRREFLAGSVALAGLAAGQPFAQAAETPTADKLIPGKSTRLIVYKSEPFEIETPLDLVAANRLTPADAIFVRNNAQPTWSATLAPAEQPQWTIEFAGLVEFPRVVSLNEIRALPQVEHEIVLQCSGNGRAMHSQLAPVKGSPWAHGAMANVRFRGVPLRTVLDKFEVRPNSATRFVTAEGFDAPGKPSDADFEHSLPLQDVLDRSFLALELNGKPLPAVHGGPVRLVTPGFYGTMHVKWVSRLRFEAQETVNYHQIKRYRNAYKPIELGAAFEYTQENSEPHWNMRVKSVIFGPGRGAELKAGRVMVNGVAWNDGQARIDVVELSRDGGQSWQRAELEKPSSRYAWHHWQLPMNLAPGKHTILCRAIDAWGRSQPLDSTADWNPAGYCWRGVDAVTVTAT